MTVPRNRLAVALAALALAGAACSGAGATGAVTVAADAVVGGGAGSRAGTPAAAPPPAVAPVAPLTGVPVPDDAVLDRPALVVKIDNDDRRGRPQSGINEADVVYEELVEGGLTRLAAVFHSRDAAAVGPVRSARSTDVGIVGSLNRPLFAWAGANPAFARLIRSSPLVDVGDEAAPDRYHRRSERRAPHNLYTSTGLLFALAGGGSAPPPLFGFRALGEPMPSAAEPAVGVRVSYGGATDLTVEYRWSPELAGWARSQAGTQHLDAAGRPVAPANVIVQFVRYDDSGQDDSNGVAVPEADLVGTGEAWLLTDGAVVRGRWVRPSLEGLTRYVDGYGNEVRLTPGTTWVALPGHGGAAVLGA